MKKIILITILLALFPTTVYAGRGCCSYHGGVSHCDTATGKQVCNDGTYSPSCTCEKEETKEDKKQNNNSSSNNKTESIYEQIINSKKEEEPELEKKLEENIDDILILAAITVGSGYLIKKHS